MKRMCKECGKEFETSSSRRLYCYDDHYRVCKGCGKLFLVPSDKLPSSLQTCSEACRRIAIANAEIYRTPRFDCVCIICGNHFLSTNKNAKVCESKHTQICQCCGKEFELTSAQALRGRLTCSERCRYTLSNQSFMKDIDSHIAKQQSTMLERYGVTSPLKVPEFLEKSKQTCITKYGQPNFTKTPQFIEKAKETNKRKYGVDWYTQTDECKSSVVNTCLTKYGVTNAGKCGAFIVDKMHCPEKLDELMRFKADPENYIRSKFSEKPTLSQLAESCGIRDSSMGEILVKAGLTNLVSYTFSKMEDEVFQFLSHYIDPEEIIRNTFKIITPYELDIYLPKYHLAIECDPTWTHNSTTCIYSESDSPKSKDYHLMKTNLCEALGIRLIHMFGYDWSWHKDTCKSMILNAIGLTNIRYYARKLCVRSVSGKEAFDFLQANHRQGGVHCKVRLGLYDKDELVSLMTFSKLRHTIGTGSDDTSECWELVRFCSKNFSTVVGGASKLLHSFICDYHPKEIRSFSDRAHTSGNLYPNLGFTELRRSDPGYVWVDIKTDKAYSRYNAQKRNIQQFLDDCSIDTSLTEVQIMSEHGFVQVFDSGTITWQLILDTRKEDIA